MDADVVIFAVWLAFVVLMFAAYVCKDCGFGKRKGGAE